MGAEPRYKVTVAYTATRTIVVEPGNIDSMIGAALREFEPLQTPWPSASWMKTIMRYGTTPAPANASPGQVTRSEVVMGWDSIPGTETNARPRLSIAAALQQVYPDAVVIDASVAKGRAYLAIRCADGQVRPVYLLLDREGFINESNPTDDPVWAKHFPVDESPTRWPLKVAEALTTWEWA